MDRLRCFVAMRFGERQADRVYDRLIKPTLIQEELTPIRIDRVQHNDNIDARIIHEIEGCDLAVADLTFARPSVYFEAGYAQRQIPVIYTCRKDHFKPKPEDKLENLCVHFDLRMKNIIPWRNEDDLRFAKDLRARIRKVIRPLLLDRARLARENESRLRFSRLPMADRTATIRNILNQQLRLAGFSEYSYERYSYNYRLRKASHEYTLVDFGVGPSVSKIGLRWGFREIREGLREFSHIAEQPRKAKPNRLIVHWIVCTLTRTPPSRVHGAFEYLAQDQINPSLYIWQNERMLMVDVPVKLYLHTIDGIQSEDDFAKRLSATLKAV